MRIALITDGTYPYRRAVAGTWCHRLLRTMPDHEVEVIAITNHPCVAAYELPANAVSFAVIATDGPAVGPRRGRAAAERRRAATNATVLLCRGLLSDTPHSLAIFRSALRRLAAVAGGGAHPLRGVPLSAILLDAWRSAGGYQAPAPARYRASAAPYWESASESGAPAARERLPLPAIPEPSRGDAEYAARLIDQALRVLAAPMPITSVNHATDASLAALAAIGAKWRSGTPFVLTEHEPYLDAELLVEAAGRPAVRALAVRFLRALARLGYQEAAVVAAPTERLRQRALDHGADRDNVRVVGYGVDPHTYPLLRYEPPEPAIAFLGPERDAVTMLDALPKLRANHRGVVLKMSGWQIQHPAPVRDGEVQFLGPVNHRRSAYAGGQVVVVSARYPAAPYAVIESMMSGRPTICIDDGQLGGVLGTAAVTVPYGDHDRLADACLALLTSPERRRHLSIAAGQRARNLFALRGTVDAVAAAYADAARDTADPTKRLPPISAALAGDLDRFVAADIDELFGGLGAAPSMPVRPVKPSRTRARTTG